MELKEEIIAYFLKCSWNTKTSIRKSAGNKPGAWKIFKWNVGSHKKQEEQQ